MIRNYLLCLLFSFAGLCGAQEGPFTLSESDLACYNVLKEAVLEQFAAVPGFSKVFGEVFAETSPESIVVLGWLLTDVGPWQETYPPRALAKIGTKEVDLYGTVGLIIYDARNQGPPLKELFEAFHKAIANGDVTSEEDLMEFAVHICLEMAFYEFRTTNNLA